MAAHGLAALATTIALSSPAAAKKDEVEKQCYERAMSRFSAQKLSLLADIPVQVESRIEIRRLEEEFCIQATQCATASMAKDAILLAAAVIFHKCLQDQAEEVYDLAPR